MKKRSKIILAVVIALCIVLGGAAVWQRHNISLLMAAYKISRTNQSAEDITAESDERIQSAIENYPELSARELTEEEKEALTEGLVNEDELVEVVLGKIDLQSAIQKHADGETIVQPSPANDAKDSPSNDDEISRLLQKVYVLRSGYNARLSSIESSTMASYAALPASERTSSVKSKLVASAIGQARSLEGSCDSEMNSILSQLSQALSKSGKDQSLVNSIRSTYESEKKSKVAYYVSKYGNIR